MPELLAHGARPPQARYAATVEDALDRARLRGEPGSAIRAVPESVEDRLRVVVDPVARIGRDQGRGART
jgi:hypothetical protein